ncbi:CatB-related O-acetyltransferase [Segetibacter aerophilus]|uniref:Acetyltransferase n=1 Tax=Segetibacter aerophilus TaxID=670293 RepID=A0A512BD38_9BACT|nr:CatB-related O-acetyltransferase [Segetibacter aerophilus]GEO09880.1 acetyltransferase [Segetibacter aerophilus]
MKLLKNLYHLFKVLYKKDIHWNYYASKEDQTTIDKNARVHKVHFFYDVVVEKGTAIGPNARISFATIGKFCSLGPNLVCGWGIHPLHGISTSPVFYSTLKQAGFTYSQTDKIQERKPVRIGNDVFIGANVTILDGVTIGDGAVIGAGAVVSKDIPPYAIAVGCPIKILRYRFSPLLIEQLLVIKWWDKDDAVLRSVEKNFFEVQGFVDSFKSAAMV